MLKKIDLSKSVYELTKEYPELIDIMVSLGFTEVKKQAMLHSIGKIMTIPKGAKVKGIPMTDVVTALLSKGFELTGDMPEIAQKIETEESLSSESQPDSRKEALKGYLKRLSAGESLDSVRADFVKNFGDVDASEIMSAEQELIKEGTPLSEVQNLCDVHSALFHGSTREEKIANAEKAVEDSVMRKKVSEALLKQASFPQRDYSDKNLRAAELSTLSGHPLHTFTKENDALAALLAQFHTDRDESILAKIREVAIHYAKKGDLLYPHLKVKYGVSGPSDVMWTVDDEIRHELGALAKAKEHNEAWDLRLNKVLTRVEEMIYKEQNILFPICAVNFTEKEWFSIYHDAKDYDPCFDVVPEKWEEAENEQPEKRLPLDGEIVMPGGHMTVEQLTALLNTIPLEISFIDSDNINRFFNEGPKVFKRPTMAIDRDVFSCHPPKIEPMVRAILDDFRNGKRDQVPVWMNKNGRAMLVTYMAVRDKDKNYLGTMELVQDMEFAKEHFKG